MLLRRVSDHASHSYYNTARDHVDIGRSSTNQRFDCRDYFGQYALYYWVRSVNRISTVLCALNVLARMVAGGFSAKSAQLYDQATAATDPQGDDTELSRSIFENIESAVTVSIHDAIAVSTLFEAAVLVFVAFSFLLFFPAVIVMFRRVELKMDTLLREMSLRSDHGYVFLPFEFSPRAADGSDTQTEMQIADARQYLLDIQSSAAAQRKRFLFCLIRWLASLIVLASHAVFVSAVAFNAHRNPDTRNCGLCDMSCQSVNWLIAVWYNFTPEMFPLVVSLCTTLPLIFSLWLMTTPEDRALLMHPSKFRTEEITLNPFENPREAQLRAERIRMGINLL